jgi:uncharacterized protein YdaU (DUF1376 family)
MHYFKRNIGDYTKKAERLSMLEHGAYTLLLDACYDREQFPTEQEAIDWCWARTDAEIAAVKFVLSKFFILEDGRYVQNRVREELDAYRAKAEKNSEIAKEREQKRRDSSRVAHVSCTDDQEPITSNHKPVTINQEDSKPQKPKTLKADASRGSRLPTDWMLPRLWGEWAIEERKDLTAEDVRKIAASFKDHWISQPSRHGVKADWEATWRNWIRKERPRTVVSFADRKAREKEESQAALDAWARGESKSTFIEGEFGRA